MNVDRYRTLAIESEGLYREKASKFIAYAFPIASEEAFALRCAAIAKEHHTCRHVCYAWVLGHAGERYRANDAGEPNGTAGKPILRRLQGAGLTEAAIVVVRYFGGTLLGKGGLVHAYGEAASLAIASNTVIERVLHTPVRILCTHAQAGSVKNDVLRASGSVSTANYADPCELVVNIPRSALERFVDRWRPLVLSLTVDQPK